MKKMIMALSFLFVSQAFALDMLVIEDLGDTQARFAFVKAKNNGVKLEATTEDESCYGEDCQSYSGVTSNVLPNFLREKRDVYFVTATGEKILCGKLNGFFRASTFTSACSAKIVRKVTCTSWYNENDCTSTQTRYQVVLSVQE
jgi:hypothetical protein